MKKTFLLMAALIVGISLPMYADECRTAPTATETNPQVCQFSLSSYRGTISAGSTDRFKVGLSCPSEEDLYATVVVYIDGQPTASEVVKVPAGKTQSEWTTIAVGLEYEGEKYNMLVQ